MSDDGLAVIICAATEWGARPSLISGTTEGVCHDCGQPIWIAPSGFALQAEHDAITVCGPCGLRSLKANPGTEIGALTKEQLRELSEALKGGIDTDDSPVI